MLHFMVVGLSEAQPVEHAHVSLLRVDSKWRDTPLASAPATLRRRGRLGR